MNELELRRRRADDENAFGRSELVRDRLEETMGIVGVLVLVLGIRPFRMAMNVVRRRLQCLLVEARGIDVEDAGFVVIDPKGDVTIRRHDGCAPFWPPVLAQTRRLCGATLGLTVAATP